jgi:hypothetical protein
VPLESTAAAGAKVATASVPYPIGAPVRRRLSGVWLIAQVSKRFIRSV